MASKDKAHPAPKPTRRNAKTYLQEWLDHRNKTHEQLASFIEMSRPHVTKIINGKRQYTQEFLEAAADYLETSPGSLLMRDPSQEDSIWSLWDQAKTGDREEILRYASFVIQQGKKRA